MQNKINTLVNSVLAKDRTNSLNAKYLLSISKKLLTDEYPFELIHSFLEIGHFPQINTIFYKSKLQSEWINLLSNLISISFAEACLIVLFINSETILNIAVSLFFSILL